MIYISLVWNVLKVIKFFLVKVQIYQFFQNFIPDFENLHQFLHLIESEDDASDDKNLKNNISEELSDVNTSFVNDRINVKNNAAKMLKTRLGSNVVSKNVVKLSKQNLTDSEMSDLTLLQPHTQ